MNPLLEKSSRTPGDVVFFHWAIYVLAFVSPLLRNLTQATAIVVLLTGAWLFLRGQRGRFLPRWESVSLLCYLTLFLLSAFIGGLQESMPVLGKIWVFLCVFPIIAYSEGISKRLVAEFLLWGTVIASAIGIGRYYVLNLERAAALSGGYTTLAFFEAAMIPLALVFFYQQKSRRRWFYMIALCLIGTGLILTGTRAGWLTAVLGLIFIGFLFSRKITIISLAVVLAAVAILPQSRAIIEKRMEVNKPGGITSGRTILWSYAMTPLAHLPLMGYGPASFPRLMPSDVLARTGDMGIRSWHSTPLETLLESGPLTLLALLIFAGLCLVRSWKNYFRSSARTPLELAFFSSLVAIYLMGLTTNLLRDMMLASYLTILCSLILATDNVPLEKNENS